MKSNRFDNSTGIGQTDGQTERIGKTISRSTCIGC